MAGGGPPKPVEHLEGELRRIKNFWQSKKETYMLKAHILLIKKFNSKTGLHEYHSKYDLSQFSISVNTKEKDKLVLEPKQNAIMKLKRVEFRCLS
jgi:hypothetical protein